MVNITQVIDGFIEQLQAGYRDIYGDCQRECAAAIASIASVVLAKIATSDAPYHDVEHTVLVTLTGQEILRGKQLNEGNVSPTDWLQAIAALLCHDIGYVKGICQQDCTETRAFFSGTEGNPIILPKGATDASLTPYHVDRGKRFVEEYFQQNQLLDIPTIQQNIELTRFPVPNQPAYQETLNYPGLVRAADLIGQLADPNYLAKMPSLFQEFAEIGTDKVLGYKHPGDLRAGYPNFFWNVVYQYIQEGVRYLSVTPQGRKIVVNLYANVEIVERELAKENTKFPRDRSDGSANSNKTRKEPIALDDRADLGTFYRTPLYLFQGAIA